MKNATLTKEESELYLKIVAEGNMDNMFDFACGVGCARTKDETSELEATLGVLEMSGRKTIKIDDVRYYLPRKE